MSDPIIIVGAGQAGAKAAETLRKLGYAGPLVLIGEEPYPPYQRPPLSKKFLAGEIGEPHLWLHGADFFRNHDITLETGRRVVSLDVAARRLGMDDGQQLAFSKLLLATGSRPRTLPLPGAARDGVLTLRGIADVARLRPAIAAAQSIVIVGAGYIGLEVAAVLVGMGRAVTVLEGQDRILKRALCADMAGAIARRHIRQGVDIRLGVQLEGFDGGTSVSAVATTNGPVLADLVLVAIGGAANDGLAAAAGLAVADGVRVDTHCRAADEVYAAGDCARFPSRRYGTDVRLESVQNAVDQARAAAAAMLGRPEVYDPVPWFWSDQHDMKLQIAGLSQGYDRSIVDGDPDGVFAISYFKGEQLLAVATLNNPRAHMEARRRLSA